MQHSGALLIEMAEVMTGTYGPKVRYCCILLLALCLLNPCQITKYALYASRMNQYDQAAQCCRACAMLLEMAECMIAFLALREGTAALNFCHWNFVLNTMSTRFRLDNVSSSACQQIGAIFSCSIALQSLGIDERARKGR